MQAGDTLFITYLCKDNTEVLNYLMNSFGFRIIQHIPISCTLKHSEYKKINKSELAIHNSHIYIYINTNNYLTN